MCTHPIDDLRDATIFLLPPCSSNGFQEFTFSATKTRLKAIVRKYGPFAIGTHTAVYAVTLGCMYNLIGQGVEIASLVEWLPNFANEGGLEAASSEVVISPTQYSPALCLCVCCTTLSNSNLRRSLLSTVCCSLCPNGTHWTPSCYDNCGYFSICYPSMAHAPQTQASPFNCVGQLW